MEKGNDRLSQSKQKEAEVAASPTDKKPWLAPRLVFVKPKLTSHGKLEDVTGFFGGFTP